MHIAVAVMMLGYTRTQGVVAFNSETKSFDLATPARARKMIDDKDLFGIKWRKNDSDMVEFYPDQEGWSQDDIMILSGLTYRPMLNDVPGVDVMNTMYSVSKVIRKNGKNMYEVVSNTFQRLVLTEEQIVELANITVVAGVRIENGIIKPCDGLPVEQANTDTSEKKSIKKDRNTADKKTAVSKEKKKAKVTH